jgi:tripartite-type tricarboxylate transporter receptor subunit TctC
VQRIHAALAKGFAAREVQEKLASTGNVIHISRSPADFNQYVATEYTRWGKVIKDGGIKAE